MDPSEPCSSAMPAQHSDGPRRSWRQVLQSIHRKTPLLHALPGRAVGIVLILIVVNIAIWIVVGIVAVSVNL